MLVKFEQNRMVRNIESTRNFVLLKNKQKKNKQTNKKNKKKKKTVF